MHSEWITLSPIDNSAKRGLPVSLPIHGNWYNNVAANWPNIFCVVAVAVADGSILLTTAILTTFCITAGGQGVPRCGMQSAWALSAYLQGGTSPPPPAPLHYITLYYCIASIQQDNKSS